MRLLLTNDDGISAPGLAVLEEIAAELVGPEGEVWVVAPAFEQSGVSHCISYTKPLMLAEIGTRRWAVEGAPADCVIAGLHDILPDAPDLVLSGVNRGNNSAENTLYSGTIGGALEGALQGVPAIALSQYYGPANVSAEDPFEASRAFGVASVRAAMEAGFDIGSDYPVFYNINFPPCLAADVKGLTTATQGRRPGVNFGASRTQAPNGRSYLWLGGGNQQVATAPGSDAQVNLDGYVSLTPMRADLTDHTHMDRLSEVLKG